MRFKNEGECVDHCPKRMLYDNARLQKFPNPDGRFMYYNYCVRQCPGASSNQSDQSIRQTDVIAEHTLVLDDACVISCPAGYAPVGNECKECAQGECPSSECPCPSVSARTHPLLQRAACTSTASTTRSR